MIKGTIKINEGLCNGRSACADAYHEGAITMMDGKARPIKDDYCDGLDDCLPVCPIGTITSEERETAVYDEAVVKTRMHQSRNLSPPSAPLHREYPESHLAQRPVQTRPAPIQAPYFKDTRLLIAANCIAFAYGNSHNDFIASRIAFIGCPKLDMMDHSEKLMEIIRLNDIKGVTIVRMEVPCCGGIENAAKRALQASGKFILRQIVTMKTDGSLIRS